MVIFSPWAFGATQVWSIWTMNALGYALGLLLVFKILLRLLDRVKPPRWGSSGGAAPRASQAVAGVLALTMFTVLVFCLTSALNARATFHNDSLVFQYFTCIPWLPHSLDAAGSRFAFWRYLGLACVFWAVVDWLTGKSSDEERAGWHRERPELGTETLASARARLLFGTNAFPLPARLRRLLWLAAVNGALVALEGMVQRWAQSAELLFILRPRINQAAAQQFGPFAYRANAAQYFNLLWPVCIGFWCALESTRRRRIRHLLLACAGLMAAAPLLSSSRGGAIVDATMGALVVVSLAVYRLLRLVFPSLNRALRNPSLALLALFLVSTFTLGMTVGWHTLSPRMAALEDGLDLRSKLYAAAAPMAADYPIFGTGPGTFETVSQLYPRPDIFWPAQLHNDWLETRITFGWVGSTLVGAMLILALLRGFLPGGIRVAALFPWFIVLALAGCLAHAAFDFPFQVQSILFLTTLLFAILFALSWRASD